MLDHPARYALFSAVVVGAWSAMLLRVWWPPVVIATGTFVLVWSFWRPGGPAERREARLYDPDGRLRDPDES